MKIALLGYGRMGRDVEQVATERGHTIAARFTIEDPLPEISKLPPELNDIHCAIDFSSPEQRNIISVHSDRFIFLWWLARRGGMTSFQRCLSSCVSAEAQLFTLRIFPSGQTFYSTPRQKHRNSWTDFRSTMLPSMKSTIE